MILAIAWTSFLLLLARLLLPYLAKMIGAQVAAFAEKNPSWARRAEQGLVIAKDMALKVVEDVGSIPIPESTTDAQRNEILRETALQWFDKRLTARNIAYGENDMRRDLEDALTAFKRGIRSQGL